MDMGCDAVIHKLNVITIGSPQYLPHMLLRPVAAGNKARIVNIYNVEDAWLRQKHFAVSFRSIFLRAFVPFKVPKSSLFEEFEKELEHQALAFNGSAITAQDKSEYIHSLGVMLVKFRKGMELGQKQYAVDVNDQTELLMIYQSLCHTTFRNMFPIVDNHIIYMLMHFRRNNESCKDLTKPLQQGGGGKAAIVYLPTKRRYKVQMEKQSKKKYIVMNKQKVYLASIRGKYRYQLT